MSNDLTVSSTRENPNTHVDFQLGVTTDGAADILSNAVTTVLEAKLKLQQSTRQELLANIKEKETALAKAWTARATAQKQKLLSAVNKALAAFNGNSEDTDYYALRSEFMSRRVQIAQLGAGGYSSYHSLLQAYTVPLSPAEEEQAAEIQELKDQLSKISLGIIQTTTAIEQSEREAKRATAKLTARTLERSEFGREVLNDLFHGCEELRDIFTVADALAAQERLELTQEVPKKLTKQTPQKAVKKSNKKK